MSFFSHFPTPSKFNRFNSLKKLNFHDYSSKKVSRTRNSLSSRIQPNNFHGESSCTEYSLDNYHRSNQDTCLVHKPAVFEGQWVQSGDLLADCAASVGGELSLGQNILIAYMPWEGYNFEDAILVSERLVYDDLYTSIHIERYETELKETKLGTEEITRNIPEVSQDSLQHLHTSGIAKLGSWIQEGDILVGKVTPISKKNQSNYQKLLYTILEKPVLPVRDSSLRAPKGINAKVIGIQIFKKKKNSFLFNSSPQLKKAETPLKKKKIIKDYQSKENSSPKESFFDRIDFSQVYNRLNQPFLEIKNRHQINSFSYSMKNLNLLSNSQTQDKNQLRKKETIRARFQKKYFPFAFWATRDKSREKPRVNFLKSSKKIKTENQPQQKTMLTGVSSIQVYLAEKRRIQVGDKMAGRHGNKGIISQILPREDMPYLPDGTPLDMVLNPLGVPSRMNVGQIFECLLGLAGKHLGENYKVFPFDEIYGAEASRSFVYSKLYNARVQTGKNWLFNPNSPGKIRLYDGRTGDGFNQAVTVGYAYMLRLVHMVDDKIHARSTGPYSLVTQQPLRGRSKQGGQRLGEMEVWALEGYGAAFTLLEMLTIKSDDMTGRMTLWSNLILNTEISIGTPESFKVLICELQALCLDIGLFRVNSSPIFTRKE